MGQIHCFSTTKNPLVLFYLPSIMLEYEFSLVDIRESRSEKVTVVYTTQVLLEMPLMKFLNYPAQETTLPGYNKNITFPYRFLADEGFALKPNMMRPYSSNSNCRFNRSEIVFNYRLSRARRIIENSFGILATRFRISDGQL